MILAEIEGMQPDGTPRDPTQLELFGTLMRDIPGMQRRPAIDGMTLEYPVADKRLDAAGNRARIKGALAACAPATSGEPTVESEPDASPTRGGAALNPAPGSGDGYPAPSDSAESAESGYPAPDEASLLPGEGYPAVTLVAPVEVDLSQLTPVAGDTTPQVMPAPGRPGGDPPINQGLLLEAVTTNLSRQLSLIHISEPTRPY